MALGDSLAAGVGATAGQGYVPRLTLAESYRTPGLTLENVSCSGATTTSMLAGGGCSYAEGNQTAAAEAFLRSHVGAVSFITIDIGANDVTPCAGHPDPACATGRIATVQSNLTQILARLRAAAPGVPIIGMTYYNPFLAQWIAGDPTAATDSIASAATFNAALTATFSAGGAEVADVSTAFASGNTAMTGSYGGVAVPQNVANVCTYTWMCSERRHPRQHRRPPADDPDVPDRRPRRGAGRLSRAEAGSAASRGEADGALPGGRAGPHPEPRGTRA